MQKKCDDYDDNNNAKVSQLSYKESIHSLSTANFGPWDVGPQHGFARTSLWTVYQSPKVNTTECGILIYNVIIIQRQFITFEDNNSAIIKCNFCHF